MSARDAILKYLRDAIAEIEEAEEPVAVIVTTVIMEGDEYATMTAVCGCDDALSCAADAVSCALAAEHVEHAGSLARTVN